MNRLPLYLGEEEENDEEWFCSLQRCTCVGNGLLGFNLYVGDVRLEGDGGFGEQVVVLPMINRGRRTMKKKLLESLISSSASC